MRINKRKCKKNVPKTSNVTKTKPQWFQGSLYKINQNGSIKFFLLFFFSKVISVIFFKGNQLYP